MGTEEQECRNHLSVCWDSDSLCSWAEGKLVCFFNIAGKKIALSSAKYILQSIARCFSMNFQQDIDQLMKVTRVVLSLMVVTLQSHKQLMSDTEVVLLYLLRATNTIICK